MPVGIFHDFPMVFLVSCFVCSVFEGIDGQDNAYPQEVVGTDLWWDYALDR